MLQPFDVGFFAPLKCHKKKILKKSLRESRHENIDRSVFPTLLNAFVSKIDSKLFKSGFNDKSNEKENNLKNLQRAIEYLFTSSPSEPSLTALANAKKVEHVSRQKMVKF